ncbi:MAG: M56 family metallopeptidase [Thermoguttaceae bacterium]
MYTSFLDFLSQMLLELAFGATVLLILAFILNLFFSKASASVRYKIWALAVIGILIFPLCTLFIPKISFSLPKVSLIDTHVIVESDTVMQAEQYVGQTPMTVSRKFIDSPVNRVPNDNTPHLLREITRPSDKSFVQNQVTQPMVLSEHLKVTDPNDLSITSSLQTSTYHQWHDSEMPGYESVYFNYSPPISTLGTYTGDVIKNNANTNTDSQGEMSDIYSTAMTPPDIYVSQPQAKTQRSTITYGQDSVYNVLSRILAIVWMSGLILGLVAMLRSFVAVHKIIQTSRGPDDTMWQTLADELAQTIGLQTEPLVLISQETNVPFVTGCRKPLVILPHAAEQWKNTQRRAILVHELTHIKRRDIAWQLLAKISCSIYWFHPLAWLASWRMQVEREIACDDAVLLNGEKQSTYAAVLMEIARTMTNTKPLNGYAVAMSRRSCVEKRICSILAVRQNRAPLGRTGAFWFTVGTLCAVSLAAILSPFESPYWNWLSTSPVAVANAEVESGHDVAENNDPSGINHVNANLQSEIIPDTKNNGTSDTNNVVGHQSGQTETTTSSLSSDKKTFTFTVTDQEGNPIQGAELKYLVSPKPGCWVSSSQQSDAVNSVEPQLFYESEVVSDISTSKTDANGNFAFIWDADHELDFFEITVIAPNYAPYLVRWEFPLADPVPDTFTAKLEQGFTVDGVVKRVINNVYRTGNGNEYPGVTVTANVELQDQNGKKCICSISTITDEDGKWRISSFPLSYMNEPIAFELSIAGIGEKQLYKHTLTKKIENGQNTYFAELLASTIFKVTKPEQIERLKKTRIPEVPKPDYTQLVNTSQDLHTASILEDVLEGMRTAINDDESRNYGGDKFIYQVLKRIGSYVILLDNNGLGTEAKKLLELPALNIDPLRWNLNLKDVVLTERKYIKDNSFPINPVIINNYKTNSISRMLNSNRVPEGYHFCSTGCVKKEVLPLYSMLTYYGAAFNWMPVTMPGRFCTGPNLSLRELADKVLTETELTLDEIKSLVESSNEYIDKLNASVLFSCYGREEESKQLYEKAIKMIDDYTKLALEYNPAFYDVNARGMLIHYHARMKQYDKMLNYIDEVEEYCITQNSTSDNNAFWPGVFDIFLRKPASELCLDGEMEYGIMCISKISQKQLQKDLAMCITAELASCGRYDDVDIILDSNYIPDDENISLVSYNMAIHDCEGKSPSQQLDILHKLRKTDEKGDVTWNLPDNTELMNKLALMLYGLKEKHSANEVFQITNDKIEEIQAGTYKEEQIRDAAFLLLARHKADLDAENLDFLKSLENQQFKVSLTFALIEEMISNQVSQQTGSETTLNAKDNVNDVIDELLQFGYMEAIKLDINTGARNSAKSNDIVITCRNDAIWNLACIALRLNRIKDMERLTAEARMLDTNTVPPEEKVRQSVLDEIENDVRDIIWMRCCRDFMNSDNIGKYDTAILAAKQISNPICRFDTFRAVAFKILWESNSTNISEPGMGGNLPFRHK